MVYQLPFRMPGVLLPTGIGLLLCASLTAAPIPRILLVGDSWAHFQWNDRSVREALVQRGLERFEERGSRTALSGTRASQWAQPEYLQILTEEISDYPSIDIVQITMGGNDLQTGASPANVSSDIEIVVDHVLGLRADIQVLLVGYDYLSGSDLPVSPRQMNNFITRFEDELLKLARRKERVEYLLNLGLMQATFGFPPHFEAGEVPLPGLPPDYTPFQGGDPNYWSPPSAFRDFLHLNRDGYVALCFRAIDLFYADWLSGEAPRFVRGDSNGSGVVDIADPVLTLRVLFIGEGETECDDACDSNDDGTVDISDAINTLGVLFLGSGTIPLPGMEDCGVDPSADGVGCEDYSGCQ